MDPLTPHRHDPNPLPPSDDPSFLLITPDGQERLIPAADLLRYPRVTVSDCYIVSTGHGTSGPFTFGGVPLAALIRSHWPHPFDQVEVISGDGFGARVAGAELAGEPAHRPILLADRMDNGALSRGQGLVRLVVPGETDDALRQVKWVATVRVRSA